MSVGRNFDVYQLSPMCQRKVLALLDEAKTELPNLVIFETRRTKERQAYLYGKGRNRLQMMWAYPFDSAWWGYSSPKSPTITWTTRSLHILGDAVDFCFDYGDGYSWYGDWKKLRELGKKHKLESLYPRESVHLQHSKKYDLKLQIMDESEKIAKELWVEADKIAKEGERMIEKSVELKNRAHALAETARNG